MYSHLRLPPHIVKLASVLAMAASSVLAQIAPARPDDLTRADTPAVIRQSMSSAVLADDSGVLRATHAAWKAEFTPAGASFIPTLGKDAPRSLPVRFTYESVMRGGVTVDDARAAAAPASVPSAQGQRAQYLHGANVRETYDARREGLELSFVFERRLPGTGDLVVRVAVDTELTAAPGSYDGGLELRDGVRPIVRIGAVLGIDALGQRQPGQIRFDGQHLDLVLPAAFVDSAAYPLTLDPLIGSLVTITDGAASQPDVAYAATSDVYLVVWQHTVSSSDRDVFAQRVRLDGTLVGSRLTLDSGTDDVYSPRVAYVRVRDAFYVVEEERAAAGRQVWGRAIAAGSGAMGAWTLIQGAFNLAGLVYEGIEPDVCGERTTSASADECVVVYVNPHVLGGPNYGVVSREMNIAANLSSSILRTVTVDTDVNARHPAVCNSGGDGRALIITWEHSPTQIYVRAMSMDSAFLSAVGYITGNSAGTIPISQPAVDGDGTNFLMSYTREDANNPSLTDLWTINWRLPSSSSGQLIYSRQAFFVNNPSQSELDSAIALARHGANVGVTFYAVTWAEGDPNVRTDSRIAVADGYGNRCGPVDTFRTFSGSPKVAATYGGGLDGDDRAMAVCTNGVDVLAHAWEVFGNGGPIVNLGGGCGLGGTLAADGPMAIGNPDWALVLNGANNGQTTSSILWLAAGGNPITCGPCRVIARDASLGTYSATNGAVRVPLPLPCGGYNIGLSLSWQFVSLTPSVNPCLGLGLSFSNILSTTFGR